MRAVFCCQHATAPCTGVRATDTARRGERRTLHTSHTHTHTHTECDDYRSADREAHPTIVGSRHCRLSVLRGALFLESHLILPRTLPSPHLPRRCSRSNVRRVDVALPVCFSLFGFLPVWWSPFLLRFFGSGLGGEVAGSRRGPHCGLDSEQKKKKRPAVGPRGWWWLLFLVGPRVGPDALALQVKPQTPSSTGKKTQSHRRAPQKLPPSKPEPRLSLTSAHCCPSPPSFQLILVVDRVQSLPLLHLLQL